MKYADTIDYIKDFFGNQEYTPLHTAIVSGNE